MVMHGVYDRPADRALDAGGTAANNPARLMKTFLETDDFQTIDRYVLVASRAPAPVATPGRSGFDVCLLASDDAQRRWVERACREGRWTVNAFDDLDALVGFASRRGPACALLDLDLPGADGLSVQAALRERLPHVATILVARRADIRSCVEAMRGGAVDFLELPLDAAVLRRSLSLAEASSRALWANELARARALERLERLTPRERQVLELVITGRRNKEIAHALASEESTVKVHRSRLMRKLGARSLVDLLSLVRPLQWPDARAS